MEEKQIDLGLLYEPFPKENISWRPQNIFERDGKFTALALAYIDARDVMDRLDFVCGAENWQCEHYDCGQGRMACKIGIKINGHWVWKTDGAGDTQVEAEKGAFSGALKRSAVAWGIGRYLYDMKNVYVPCETYKKNGKDVFKNFSVDPWSCVKQVGFLPENIQGVQKITAAQLEEIERLMNLSGVDAKTICDKYKVAKLVELPFELYNSVINKLNVTIANKQLEGHDGNTN